VHRDEAARWRRQEVWLSRLRLAVFAAGLAIGWLAFGTHRLAPVWILPPVLAFAGLVFAHDRVIRRRMRADRSVAYFEAGLARIEERWTGQGNAGERHRDAGHPYADDLDLFGPGSLFELVCSARSAGGQSLLADWLCKPAGSDEVRARQQAVVELTPRVDLRRDLALLGEDLGEQISPDALVAWGAGSSWLLSHHLRAAAAALSTLSLAGLGAWLLTPAGPIPFLFALALQSLFAAGVRRRVRPVLAAVAGPSKDLAQLSGLLERIEGESVTAPRLAELRGRLDTEGRPPSQRIAELQRLVDLLDARRNQFFAPIGGLLLWGTQVAVAIEIWRRRCGASLAGWIAAASEMEALCALSGYAYEHPQDVFPEIVAETDAGGAVYEARGLGHPLLPRARCVRNDVALGGDLRGLMMSGSNMSGKSTLLRSVGSSIALALAGAPVRADSVRLSPLQVAASIRISDSLQQGTSHFYAEIKRLRQIVDLTESELPVLFLLDEVLHGTNSHDRRIGAEAVVRGLLARGALGIVTTHDLALAHIADELAPRMANVHFEDHIEDGRIRFDYRMRPGVVTKSNAIELMRSVGLVV
jgi:hypothetical protein